MPGTILDAGDIALKKVVMTPALKELPVWYSVFSPGFILESLRELEKNSDAEDLPLRDYDLFHQM